MWTKENCTKDMQRRKGVDKAKEFRCGYVKRIGVLIGACLPHCSLQWYLDKVSEFGQIYKLKIEIKKINGA